MKRLGILIVMVIAIPTLCYFLAYDYFEEAAACRSVGSLELSYLASAFSGLMYVFAGAGLVCVFLGIVIVWIMSKMQEIEMKIDKMMATNENRTQGK
jgi:hypothetical protein